VILLYVCISFYFANLYLFFCISLCESPCCILFLYLITLLLIFPAFFQPSGVLIATPQSMPALQPASPAVASPAVASPSVRAVVVPSSTSATRIPVPASPAVVHDSKAVDLVHCIVCFCAVYIPF
jgi:hypothetical protein